MLRERGGDGREGTLPWAARRRRRRRRRMPTRGGGALGFGEEDARRGGGFRREAEASLVGPSHGPAHIEAKVSSTWAGYKDHLPHSPHKGVIDSNTPCDSGGVLDCTRFLIFEAKFRWKWKRLGQDSKRLQILYICISSEF